MLTTDVPLTEIMPVYGPKCNDSEEVSVGCWCHLAAHAGSPALATTSIASMLILSVTLIHHVVPRCHLLCVETNWSDARVPYAVRVAFAADPLLHRAGHQQVALFDGGALMVGQPSAVHAVQVRTLGGGRLRAAAAVPAVERPPPVAADTGGGAGAAAAAHRLLHARDAASLLDPPWDALLHRRSGRAHAREKRLNKDDSELASS